MTATNPAATPHGGPLSGLRVVEMEAIGPLLHAGMMLADLGADVVRIVRPPRWADDDGVTDPNAGMLRGRAELQADLTDPSQLGIVRDLLRHADVLLEGSRPGAMEKLGLGPDVLLAENPRLVYGRMTGWGQEGPLARRAGHDVNYLAIAGALEPLGPANGPPVPPVNYVGNFGGGSMFLLVGVLAALHERERTDRGQVVDAAMADGASSLTSLLRSWEHAGRWSPRRGTNLLDGSAPFYRAYECADGRFVAVGALEDVFYERFLGGLGLDPADLADRWNPENWPGLTQVFSGVFATRDRAEWSAVFEHLDACVTPVLTLHEATLHPQATERAGFVEDQGFPMPAAAPRLASSEGAAPPRVDADVRTVMSRWSADGVPRV
ncbi:CaiB/BaiF CoA-transferase family protein [Dietzia aurantiaca]|uniref:CaiB/BaiF CoA-transferase family protein n=1 Tax=Dietzia aurantiaca TaxID=983873 RepID=A0ABV9PSG6_9ACTN